MKSFAAVAVLGSVLMASIGVAQDAPKAPVPMDPPAERSDRPGGGPRGDRGTERGDRGIRGDRADWARGAQSFMREMQNDWRDPGRGQMLEKPVKLTFRLMPEEKDAQPMSVICAGREYRFRIAFKNGEQSYEFEVSGQVRSMDGERLMVAFDAGLQYENKTDSGSMAAQGSSVFAMGEKKSVARLGTKSLEIVVEPEG